MKSIDFSSEQFRKDESRRLEGTDNSFLSLDDLANIANPKSSEPTESLVEPFQDSLMFRVDDLEELVLNKAIENFGQFVSSIAEDEEEIEELRSDFFKQSFEESVDNLYEELEYVYSISNKIKVANKYFLAEVSDNIELFWNAFSKKLSFLFDSAFLPEKTHTDFELWSLLNELISCFYSIYEISGDDFAAENARKTNKFSIDASFETVSEPMLLERLAVFIIPGKKRYRDESTNIKIASEIIQTLGEKMKLYLEKIRYKNYDFADIMYDKYSQTFADLSGKQIQLLRLIKIDEKVICEKEENYKKIQKLFDENDPLFSKDLKERKKNKLRIFLLFEKLFYDLLKRNDPSSVKQIAELLFLAEPSWENASPITINTFPSTFISESELRALRLYFVSIFVDLPNASESFKHRELQLLKEYYREVLFQEAQLDSISQGLISELREYKFQEIELASLSKVLVSELREYKYRENPELESFLLEKLMEIEYGLVVRDRNTGREISHYENKTIGSDDGQWHEVSPENLSPNYTPELRAFNICHTGQAESCDKIQNIDSLKRYIEMLLTEPEDLIEEFRTNAETDVELMFSDNDPNLLLVDIDNDIRLLNEEGVDRKVNVLINLDKLSKILAQRSLIINKRKEDFEEDYVLIKKIFDRIDTLKKMDLVFNNIEILSLKFLMLKMYINRFNDLYEIIKDETLKAKKPIDVIDYLNPVKYWHYGLFSKLFEARKQYEEALSSIVPFIDGLQELVRKRCENPEIRDLIFRELRACEFGLSPRQYTDFGRRVHRDPVTLTVRAGFNETVDEELSSEQKSAEVIELAKYKKAQNALIALKKYAIPSVAIFFIFSLVFSAIEKVFNEKSEDLTADGFIDVHNPQIAKLSEESSSIEGEAEPKITEDGASIEKVNTVSVESTKTGQEAGVVQDESNSSESVSNETTSSVSADDLSRNKAIVKKPALASVTTEKTSTKSVKLAENQLPIDNKDLLEKYDSGELPFLSSGAKDDIGYLAMSESWPAVENASEAKEIFLSLSSAERAEINKITKRSLQMNYDREKKLSIEELRNLVRSDLL